LTKLLSGRKKSVGLYFSDDDNEFNQEQAEVTVDEEDPFWK
jgi:hypothetical protein